MILILAYVSKKYQLSTRIFSGEKIKHFTKTLNILSNIEGDTTPGQIQAKGPKHTSGPKTS